ncbi:acyl-CoA thioesterase [Nannocystis pusilla]|uniref:Acyl-CoA thioesterase n=1 Tax=Nannocystis pusilla TaxID=889268 RepID=A0ABS7TL06_9BACT|nr:acyl-CoA thioesterase [Nannocystis pusilla]
MSRLHEVSVEFEVPFHDVDILNIVWHGHYYKYMEIGRTALMRSRGLDIADIRRAGYAQLLVDSHCRYTYPLRYADRARVDAWFVSVTPRLVIAYRIRNLKDDRCSARGQTILVTTDHEGRLLPETPDALLKYLV